ncbi:hypothetical protein CDAR_386421 [Caerostris darwini]|uniref:Uncharacterized protein n=1 Tax=Caerostris darwini TaxID=1538125 RepID=A0AAV4QGX4_9ARAC|nr:hypothetical protein CDAR_386421 [Caerostris darwini]
MRSQHDGARLQYGKYICSHLNMSFRRQRARRVGPGAQQAIPPSFISDRSSLRNCLDEGQGRKYPFFFVYISKGYDVGEENGWKSKFIIIRAHGVVDS